MNADDDIGETPSESRAARPSRSFFQKAASPTLHLLEEGDLNDESIDSRVLVSADIEEQFVSADVGPEHSRDQLKTAWQKRPRSFVAAEHSRDQLQTAWDKLTPRTPSTPSQCRLSLVDAVLFTREEDSREELERETAESLSLREEVSAAREAPSQRRSRDPKVSSGVLEREHAESLSPRQNVLPSSDFSQELEREQAESLSPRQEAYAARGRDDMKKILLPEMCLHSSGPPLIPFSEGSVLAKPGRVPSSSKTPSHRELMTGQEIFQSPRPLMAGRGRHGISPITSKSPISPAAVAVAAWQMQETGNARNQDLGDVKLQIVNPESEESAETIAKLHCLKHGVRKVWDPVWGELELLAPSKSSTASGYVALAVPCFYACPGLVVVSTALCGSLAFRRLTNLRSACRLFLCSWSSAFALAQLLVLIAAIARFGLADVSENFTIGPFGSAFDPMGAKNTAKILYLNQWWRLITPIFMHSGFLHLAGNILIQLRVGVSLEVLWGHTSWLFIYLVSGIASSLASCVWSPELRSVGSSGALCGLLGAWLPFTLLTWHEAATKDDRRRRWAQLAISTASIILMAALSFLPLAFDVASHIGGLVSGLLLGSGVFSRHLQRPWHRWGMFCFAFGLFIASFAAGICHLVFDSKPSKTLLLIP